MWKHLLWISGRASRIELIFWGIILQFITGIYVFLQYLTLPLSPLKVSTSAVAFGFVFMFLTPVCAVAGWMWITLLVRRLHDINLSGWWFLVFVVMVLITKLILPTWYITYVTSTIGICLMGWLIFASGTSTSNKYGEVPTKTYAPQFLANKNSLTVSAIIFLILCASVSLCQSHISKLQMKKLEQFQQQYLEQMTSLQENF